VLVAGPAAKGLAYHPFANNLQFGWVYQKPEDYKTVFAIGYREAATGAFKPYPNGYGGFLDYRHTGQINRRATLVGTGTANLAAVKPAIDAYLCARRERGSNQRLLGPLALPDHRWLLHSEAAPSDLSDLYILKGTPDSGDVADPFRVVRVTWEPLLRLDPPRCSP
jgi:hypothetical protein